MSNLKTLIDKASQVCGSDAELARRMGVKQTVISDMRHRDRKISPATAAELADIAGEDAREAAIAAVIESTKGTRREGAMREILGKALAAGVMGMSLISYSGDSISRTAPIEKSNDRLTVDILYLSSACLEAIKPSSRRSDPRRG